MARLMIGTSGPNDQYTRHVSSTEDKDVAPIARDIFRKRIASHLVRVGVTADLIGKCADVFEATLALTGSPDAAVAKTYDLIDGVFGMEKIGAAGTPFVDEAVVEWLSGNWTAPIVGITRDLGLQLDDTVPRATRRAAGLHLIKLYRTSGPTLNGVQVRPTGFSAVVKSELARLQAGRKRLEKNGGVAGFEVEVVEAWAQPLASALSLYVDTLIADRKVRQSPLAKALKQSGLVEARVHAS